jgi:hypothetical protein
MVREAYANAALFGRQRDLICRTRERATVVVKAKDGTVVEMYVNLVAKELEMASTVLR